MPEATHSSTTDNALWPSCNRDTQLPDVDWTALMTSIDDFVVPDLVGPDHSDKTGVLEGDFHQERMVYAVKQMQAIPSMLVNQGQTYFLHHALYRENMPSAIQDILGVSALYCARNEANRTLVLTTIREKVRQLIQSSSESPFEQLAAIQALVVYQIIRYFDGDIRLRADAERTEPTLIHWAKQMQLRITAAEATDLELVADPWRSWIFAESQRRTLMMCFLLKGLYCFLRNGYDNAIDDFKGLSFFAQTALWTAPSEYYWRHAIQNSRMLPVGAINWDGDLVEAEPSDLDGLGMTIMVLMKGVDHCSEWVGEQQLDKFGLRLSGAPIN